MATEEVHTRVDGRILRLTNLTKPLYPTGFTKAEVIDYYLKVAPVLLPHLRDRVLTRVRFPDGVDDESFFEKRPPSGAPDWLRTQSVATADGELDYVVADDTATLVYLANLASLELHVPQWRIGDRAGSVIDLDDDPPSSTTLVADLDPGAGLSIADLGTAALLVANRLAADGFIPQPRSSGSKGVQVYAAIAPTPGRVVQRYLAAISRELVQAHPKTFVLGSAIAERAGRVFLDHLQNQSARTTVAPYSLRGRARPQVATPLTWDEVAAARNPEDLHRTPEEVLSRVAEHGDLAEELLLSSSTAVPETGEPSVT